MRNWITKKWYVILAAALFICVLCTSTHAQQSAPLVLERLNPETDVVQGGRMTLMLRTNGVKYPRLRIPNILGLNKSFRVTKRDVGGDIELVLEFSRFVPIGPFDYSVTAETEAGEKVKSNTVSVTIEASERIKGIRAWTVTPILSTIGSELEFNPVGIGESGKEYPLSDSSRLSISSSNPSVVLVERTPPRIVSLASGTANIKLEYRYPFLGDIITLEVPVTVKVGMKGDLNLNGIVNESDLLEIMSRIEDWGDVVQAPGDSMDLNSDGVINVEDVWEVAKLCSYDNCGGWDPAKNPGRATPTPLSFRGTPIAIGRNQRNPATPTPTPTPHVFPTSKLDEAF